MIKQFRAKNFKSLRDVSIQLTPVHALIGPNNSGKTSILSAIQALCRSVDYSLPEAFVGTWKGRELVWHGAGDAVVTLEVVVHDAIGDFEYSLSCSFPSLPTIRDVRSTEESSKNGSAVTLTLANHQTSRVFHVARNGGSGGGDNTQVAAAKRVHDALSGVVSCRWDPRLLALPTAPDSSRRFRMDTSGFGLALCLDEILGYDRSLFMRLENRFIKIFPEVKSIKLIPEAAYRAPIDSSQSTPLLQPSDGKGIYFQLENNPTLVPATQASDGVLIVLAYLAVLSLPQPPRVVLVEEPENGIHPSRLRDVLLILRDLVNESQDTQIILTTHSPYVLDLFAPEEVTVCRQQNGEARVSRLSESKAVREQRDIFNLGEIWTAVGDERISVADATASGG